MFQFRPFPAYDYFIHRTLYGSSPYGFPHSDICGSKLICSSPQLFAACHVLHRLLMPRHSPCALLRLNSFLYLLDTTVLLLELLCFTFAVFFASGKIVFYPSGKTWFLKSCLFPLLFTVRVLSSILSYKWLHFLLIRFSMSSPAFIRLLRHQPFG